MQAREPVVAAQVRLVKHGYYICIHLQRCEGDASLSFMKLHPGPSLLCCEIEPAVGLTRQLLDGTRLFSSVSLVPGCRLAIISRCPMIDAVRSQPTLCPWFQRHPCYRVTPWASSIRLSRFVTNLTVRARTFTACRAAESEHREGADVPDQAGCTLLGWLPWKPVIVALADLRRPKHPGFWPYATAADATPLGCLQQSRVGG